MKTLIFTSLLITGTAFAAPTAKTLGNVSSVYKEMNDYLMDGDLHLYLNFAYKRQDVVEALANNKRCNNNQNYKVTHKKKVLETMQEDLTQEFEMVDDGSWAYLERLEAIFGTLSKELGTSKIEICKEYSMPAYSDGHEASFVKVDGKLVFVFEKGQPD